ncbi:hypothetical protein K875_02518 [Mycobacterium [tuberculosis] TKK-01-0051]|uniref:Uncharacterized protein n=1 Tax=Mycobacterium [tuberculosis] TKK-01-0051 TaxID=1324261 RepID=A0A051U5C0_9MYCO|nr:hypothetical protein [Mycobacterium colombiense]KBZ63806.1 hypothetical protein K875_02518 [Mycobacterium [tuberculosis] TKK-01-0051]
MHNSFSMLDAHRQTSADEQYATRIQEFSNAGEGDTLAKLKNFPKFVPRQSIATFLAKDEIFKQIFDVHGHIVEWGVFVGDFRLRRKSPMRCY